MHIGVIGAGYVGLVTGACFAEFGVNVMCADKDEEKIRALKSGKLPFYEPGLDSIVEKNVKKGLLSFTTRLSDAVGPSLVVFIAVGTPPRGDGSADLSYVEEVAKEVALNLDGYKVVVTKSTVPVGTGRKLKELIRGNLRGEGGSFDVASNPEFLREGSAIEDFMRPNRVIIGAESPQAIAILKDLYNPLYLIETPFVVTDMETAELIKYASNSFLAMKISYINELSRLCEKLGADVRTVAKGIGLDRRIGPKFLHAGPGFGGSCFPKDTRAIISLARENGIELKMIESSVLVNEEQKALMSGKIKDAMGPLEGRTIAVLGLSFKPNTDDMREAPAITIIEKLVGEKAMIRAYDPVAVSTAKKALPEEVLYFQDPYEAARGADAIVILTEWNELRNLDLDRLKKLLNRPYFFDLRNIYEPARMRQAGFKYYSVGRP
ncbi:MAG: UDP-glucose/GDP-mannose dehydrogenase family protein [Nitrospiraceae bacterium]|nr:UDP-glucose/GDP-mannose dehydrogenase family protein [Nitrospiraceae bacterium]